MLKIAPIFTGNRALFARFGVVVPFVLLCSGVFHASSSASAFVAAPIRLILFRYLRKLVSPTGVKRCRGRAHLTSLRERRRSPEHNLGKIGAAKHTPRRAVFPEVCDGPKSWIARASEFSWWLPRGR